jgi:ATP-binding cassette subfamily G (WHITE) protein 2 (SNQ2)
MSSRNDLGPNQVCTLFGAQSGSDIISGHDYLLAGYGIDTADLWRRNFLVVVGFFLLFQVTQFLALELHPVSILLSVFDTLA